MSDVVSDPIVSSIADPYASLRDEVLQHVLDGPAASTSAIRHAAFDGKDGPAELQPVIEKIHHHAYKVTDTDLSRLATSYSDDQLFEIVVSAALGAARQRLQAGLDALERA